MVPKEFLEASLSPCKYCTDEGTENSVLTGRKPRCKEALNGPSFSQCSLKPEAHTILVELFFAQLQCKKHRILNSDTCQCTVNRDTNH